MISAIVVAAGKSSRMGTVDKLRLPFGNSTILETVLKNLSQSQVDEIVLVSSRKLNLPRDKNDLRIKMVLNPTPDEGLTSSIQMGVRQASMENDLMICLGDMPLLNKSNYNQLIDKFLTFEKEVIIQPVKGAIPGNPVLFSNHFRKAILNLQEADGCKPVVQSNRSHVQTLEVENRAFFTDIDTKEQYNKLV